MTKQIILLRHAQTSGKQAGQRDYDRALTPEGEAQGKKIGTYFASNSISPDILISSSALRAKQTALIINEFIRLTPQQLVFLEGLYEADGDTWLGEIRQLHERLNTVLCIGHNPTLSWLAGHLAGRPVDLPPGGFVIFRSPSPSWATFTSNPEEVSLTDRP